MVLPLPNVTFVLLMLLWSKVKKVCVLMNAQKVLDKLVLTQLHSTLNSVKKINTKMVVSILQLMLLIQPVLVSTVSNVVDLLKTNV